MSAGFDVYRPHLERLRAEAPEQAWHVLDIDKDRGQLPQADVALVKDVLMHWPNALVRDWLTWASTSRKWRWLVLTFDVANAVDGADCPLGGYRPLRADFEPLASFDLVEVARFLHKVVYLMRCGAP